MSEAVKAQEFKFPKTAMCGQCETRRRIEPGDVQNEDIDRNENIVTVSVVIPLECTKCNSEIGRIRFQHEVEIPASAEVELDDE